MINTYSIPNLVFFYSAGGIREPRCTSFSNLGYIKGTSIIFFYIGIRFSYLLTMAPQSPFPGHSPLAAAQAYNLASSHKILY